MVNSRSGFAADIDSKEFQSCCISLANEIDGAIGKNEVPVNVQEVARILNHVCAIYHICQRRCNDQTKAVIMVLMISAKSACQLGWFSQRETQKYMAFINSMWKGFTSPGDAISGVTSLFNLMPQVMERFYPFVRLGEILVSIEAKQESNVLVKDFHISKKIQKTGLFVVRTDDISKSSCIIHPQNVSFLLNGKLVENRVHISMDPGPQLPTNVTPLLNHGANLLQAIGCFGGSYFVLIASVDVIPLPNKPPVLKDYVHSEVTESDPDGDVIEGSSRISLSCPISRTRIKLPVKGHVCRHLQCFDFWNYVNINKRRPSWRCPHCNQSVCYTDIRVDQNMKKILGEVGRNAASVFISADGSWKVVTENDENLEPNSFLNVGPTVMDLTRDDNDIETSGGTQVDEQKPCLSEIQGPSTNTNEPATDYTMLNQSSASINELPQLPQTLNAFDVQQQQQQFMNHPQVVNTRDSAASQAFTMGYLPNSSPQDRIATNAASFHTSIPASQSSQFQGSPVTPLGHCQGRTPDLMQRWNHLYGNATNQTQSPPMRPPLQHHYGMQQNQMLPNRRQSPAQQRPMSSPITHPQTFTTNYGGTSNQRPMQRRNHGGAVQQQYSSREFMNTTSANSANWRPLTRMRGSLMPGSTGYEHMIIRPTRPVQAQAQTLPPPQAAAYTNNNNNNNNNHYIGDDIQAYLGHPTNTVGMNETQDGLGSMPVAEGFGASASFWSMPPEAW